MKTKYAITITIVGMLLLSTVMSFWLAPQIFFAQRDAAREGVDQTYQWENARENYEWFRTQYHDIKAQREQLENYREQHKNFHKTYGNDSEDWARNTRNRHSRIMDRITASENMIENMISEYNARSDMAHKAIFKCHLPYKLNEKLYIADATGVEYTSGTGPGTVPPVEKCDELPKEITETSSG